MKRPVMMVALVALAAAPMAAQAKHVDYSGTWVLDVAKSTGAQLPTAATWTIAQHGDTITTDRETETSDAVGATRTHIAVTTDGTATNTTIPQGGTTMPISVTASWDSTGVTILTAGNSGGYDFVLHDHWTLSPDGKTLVSDRTVTVGDQVVASNTLTFNRKP